MLDSSQLSTQVFRPESRKEAESSDSPSLLPHMSDAAVGQMDFAFEMLRQLDDPKESVVLSPTSLAIALGACMIGADGKTLQEMKDVLSTGLLFLGDDSCCWLAGKIERSASLKCTCVKPVKGRRKFPV